MDDPFQGGGEAAALMRAADWSATPLGPVHEWPQSLRTIVRVILTSKFAMWVGWGSELIFLYNDAYAAMTLGAKHPWALGRPAHEVWAEIWSDIRPRIEQVRQTGEATWDENLLLFLERNGYREETYHTFSYSPVTDDAGVVAGTLCVVTEQTERVIAERRMALLRDTAAGIAAADTADGLFDAVARTLAASPDLPFTLTYLQQDDETQAGLISQTGLLAARGTAPAQLDLAAASSPWFFGGTADAAPRVVDPADLRIGTPLGSDAHGESGVHGAGGAPEDSIASALPTTDTDIATATVADAAAPPAADAPRASALAPAISVRSAMLVPLPSLGTRGGGLFVAGLNPARPADDGYRTFVNLFAGQLGAGLAKVHAYDEERRRAEALAALDRAKTTFFSNISHEFRTPLTLLIGHLEEARQGDDPPLLPALRDQLDVAHRNSLRLLKLVNTLLDFSRIEAGRVCARFEPLDLPAFTAELASTFESAMQRAGLTYSVDCPAAPEPVFVDREMWEAIVLNLVSNAFKFTLQGTVAVSLSQQDGCARLRVRDTGVGIPAHELPRILERFHRVEGAQGRSHEGSGIGLSLVHELVKLHGGRLTAESELGHGTQFEVSLPLGRAHLSAEHLASAPVARKTAGAAPYVEEALRWLPSSAAMPAAAAAGPDDAAALADELTAGYGRVLLADDNADMREYARRLLGSRWTVEAVGNGRAALQAARARRPDVIVTDVMMPELDGFGLLAALRADPELRALPVIMLSARAGEEARLEGLAASADDYLVKPFSARDLLGRVAAQVDKARARAMEEHHARRLSNLLAHAPVAIAVLRGPAHQYEVANARYLELVGNRQIVGKPIRDALPELDGQGIFQMLDDVRASGEPVLGHSLRVMLNRGPGLVSEECFFDFVYQPMFDAAGAVDAIVVIAHDVTTLASAKREAETANRLKDEFLATLSHELRTPLNAVLGYAQMARAGVLDAGRLPAVLETIERNAALQRQLIDDVLDMSRIVTGNLRLDIGSVDLTRVIQEAVETVALAATAKGIKLDCRLDRPALPLAGDARRLQQVIWNLLSNAIKFTPRGGHVEIELRCAETHVDVIVNDSGEGIDPAFLPHLFQRFRQADSTLTREHGGLGLGLAICRHLIEAHGGRIEAVSAGKGQGTCVRFELPLMQAESVPVLEPTQATVAEPVPVPAEVASPAEAVTLSLDGLDGLDGLTPATSG